MDITGTLDDVRQEAVIAYDAVHHRDNPVFHALIPAERGIAPSWDYQGPPRSRRQSRRSLSALTCT